MFTKKAVPSPQKTCHPRPGCTKQRDVWRLVRDTAKADEILNKGKAMYLLD